MSTFGGLHVLYNNAGISPGDDDGPTNTSDETWSTVLDVNVTGVARCCRHGIPAMLDVGRRQHRQRRLVRRPHGRGDAADRLHRVEGRRARR